jgi:hypothetical protein
MVRLPLVGGKWGRQALVDVLRGVHHDRNRRRRHREDLACGKTEWLFVNVYDVWPEFVDQPTNLGRPRVAVSIDIARTANVQLDHPEPLVGYEVLSARPAARDGERHVDAGTYQRSLTSPVT